MLGEINAKLSQVNDELNAKMAESMNAPQSGSGPVSVGSTRNGAVGGIGPLPASLGQRDSQPQAQYCGPYRLEKTLGKGQTGIKHTHLCCYALCLYSILYNFRKLRAFISIL